MDRGCRLLRGGHRPHLGAIPHAGAGRRHRPRPGHWLRHRPLHSQHGSPGVVRARCRSVVADARRGGSRAAAEGLTNVEFVQADAQVHPFEDDAFDLAISSFGAMFFSDAIAAFTNIGAALRPDDGRLAILSWQGLANNEWLRAYLGVLDAGRNLTGPPVGVPGPSASPTPTTCAASSPPPVSAASNSPRSRNPCGWAPTLTTRGLRPASRRRKGPHRDPRRPRRTLSVRRPPPDRRQPHHHRRRPARHRRLAITATRA